MKKLLIPLFCLGFMPGFCQWISDPAINNPVSISTSTDSYPVAVSDGAGGSIVFFERMQGNDVYAQKITAAGTIAWGTATAPVIICNAADVQYILNAIPDGLGGAFVCWLDYRNDVLKSEIYIQHINNLGTALWTINGVRVTTTTIDELEHFMCSDGAGGVIVAWNWDDGVSNIQINAQRFNSAGIPQWIANGVQVCTAPGFRYGLGIIPDGSNGAIFCFEDTRNDVHGTVYDDLFNFDILNMDIYAQRLSGSGARLWDDNAVPACTAPGNQTNYSYSSLVSDGSGGAIFSFDDGRNDVPDISGNATNTNIYSQRLNSSGAPQWALNGLPISTAAGNQTIIHMLADAANGFVITWDNDDAGHIYSQRINLSGTPLWSLNGLAVSPPAQTLYDAEVTADGTGNYIYAYHSPVNNTVLAQKLNINGIQQWGAAGTVVCNANNAFPGFPKIVLSDNAGVIIIWDDQRNYDISGYDIYASKVLTNGLLAGTATSGYVTIANGNWNNAATWQGGIVPPSTAQVTIRHLVTVTANATCYSATIEQPSGNLTVNTGVNFLITH